MPTELEKTQLEIAKLQLEQERHKLAQMQKRQKVVNDLGSGAAAVGGATVSVAWWLFWVFAGAVVTGVSAWVGACLWALVRAEKPLCRTYPDADLLYRIGCALGESEPAWMIHAVTVVGVLYGMYGGHKIAVKNS